MFFEQIIQTVTGSTLREHHVVAGKDMVYFMTATLTLTD